MARGFLMCRISWLRDCLDGCLSARRTLKAEIHIQFVKSRRQLRDGLRFMASRKPTPGIHVESSGRASSGILLHPFAFAISHFFEGLNASFSIQEDGEQSVHERARGSRAVPPPSKVLRARERTEEDDDAVFFDQSAFGNSVPPMELDAAEPMSVPPSAPSTSKKTRRKKAASLDSDTPTPAQDTGESASKPHRVKAAEKQRAKRVSPEHKDAQKQKKMASASEEDEQLAAEWYSETSRLFEHSRFIDALLKKCPPNASVKEQRQMLRDLFEFASKQDHLESVPADSPFWAVLASLDSFTITFLASLARGLHEQDIQDAIEAGVLRLSPPGDTAPVLGSLMYLRVGTSESSLNAARACLVASPADSPWTILRLLQLGMSLEDVATCIEETLRPFGHDKAVGLLFNRLKNETQIGNLRVHQHWLWTYGGTSHDQQPSGRHADDVKAAHLKTLPTRFGRFLQMNKSCTWDCYELLALRLLDSPGIRSDPVASAMERLVVALQGGCGLNSAVGGFFRPYDPEPTLKGMVQDVHSSFPGPVFGSQRADVSQIVALCLEDERSFETQAGGPRMHDDAFRSAVKNAASVLRSNGHSVPFLRAMKDVTVEAFVAGGKAVWDANAGPGPQLFRHLQSLLDPELRRDGDLTEEEIAGHLGASADFWRVVTGTPNYWRQTKWMELLEMVNDGTTPADIDRYLPPPHHNKSWYPKLDDKGYLDAIGFLFIAQIGPESTDLILVIPNLHCGVSKYRPRQSYLVEAIILTVCAIERVALGHVQRLHDEGVDPDWSDATSLRRYFTHLKAIVEAEVVVRGLRSYLEDAKKQYRTRTKMSQSLEQKAHPRRGPYNLQSAPYVIPGITHTSAIGAAREEQLEKILKYLSSIIDAGFPEAAFHLIPFHLREHIHSPAFRTWFLSLPPAIRISRSARIWGNTEEANQATVANHAKFGANKEAHRLGGKMSAAARAAKVVVEPPSTKLRTMLSYGGDLIKTPPPGRKDHPLGSLPSLSSFRAAFCTECDEFVIGGDSNAKHRCTNAKQIPIRDSHITNLERLLYPHDVLGNPDLAALVPVYNDLVTAIKVEDIFKRPGNRTKAKELFPTTDFTGLRGLIYVSLGSKDPAEHNNLHLGMALDYAVGAMSLSQCPQRLWPTTATSRSKAWTGSTNEWLDGAHYVVTCAWQYWVMLSRLGKSSRMKSESQKSVMRLDSTRLSADSDLQAT
ncbi:hypothetical protein B0H19DRAFT_1071707 [Mycena capillaripes]|nr:hypothetical protein B0H19DRAFT_1071707 [Mycena capillaripes]